MLLLLTTLLSMFRRYPGGGVLPSEQGPLQHHLGHIQTNPVFVGKLGPNYIRREKEIKRTGENKERITKTT